MGVADQFLTFCRNLTVNNRDTISGRYKLITRRLNLDFWNLDNDTSFSRYVGSYGRGTAIRGFSDLDMLFILPASEKTRYSNYAGNGQSALLQAIRTSIQKTYPNTSVGGDGQVVVVAFSDGMRFEVVPVFENADGSYTYPDSNSGGSWKKTDPMPEIRVVKETDSNCNGNLVELARMARAWRRQWDVPIGGLLIDTLAARFLSSWQYRTNSYLYYDWMSRDFFEYLSNQDPNQNYWSALGSAQPIFRKGPFEYKALRAFNLSKEAIKLQTDNYPWSSQQKWREVYGTAFPN